VLINLSKRGHKCGIVILTRGKIGGGTIDTRVNEVQEAARNLGAESVMREIVPSGAFWGCFLD
jgi:LmbE family N-acetylglucosaminyl deacetylase